MAYSKMATLVCPVSKCLTQGLYEELFLIGALNGLQRWQRKCAFRLKPLFLKQMLYAFLRREYRVLTDTSPLFTTFSYLLSTVLADNPPPPSSRT